MRELLFFKGVDCWYCVFVFQRRSIVRISRCVRYCWYQGIDSWHSLLSNKILFALCIVFNQGVDDENKKTISADKFLNTAFGRDTRVDLPTSNVAASVEGISRFTGERIRGVALDALAHHQEVAVESALASVAGKPAALAGKLAWDETGLRMYFPKEQVDQMFPEFSFDTQAVKNEEIKRKANRPIKTSYLVQIMQKEGRVLIGDVEENHFLKPSVVASTSAEDLRRPLLGMGLMKPIAAADNEDHFSAYCLHGDSLAANKVIVADIAEQFPGMCIQDAHCTGRRK